jgi:hypothetical protein
VVPFPPVLPVSVSKFPPFRFSKVPKFVTRQEELRFDKEC